LAVQFYTMKKKKQQAITGRAYSLPNVFKQREPDETAVEETVEAPEPVAPVAIRHVRRSPPGTRSAPTTATEAIRVAFPSTASIVAAAAANDMFTEGKIEEIIDNTSEVIVDQVLTDDTPVEATAAVVESANSPPPNTSPPRHTVVSVPEVTTKVSIPSSSLSLFPMQQV